MCVSDKLIDTIDPDGVALAAIQGLHALVQEKDAVIDELRSKQAAMEMQLAARGNSVLLVHARLECQPTVATRPFQPAQAGPPSRGDGPGPFPMRWSAAPGQEERVIVHIARAESPRQLVLRESLMQQVFFSCVVTSFLATAPGAFQRSAPVPAPTGNVFVVDDSGGPGVAFTELQPAVEAASDGDVLLVRSGTYSAFTIDGKALILQAEVGAHVKVKSILVIPADVRNLGADQWVVLRGIDLDGGTLGGFPPPTNPTYVGGFASTNNAGNIWVEDCQILGTAGGAEVRNSSSVVFIRCQLRGEDIGGNLFLLGAPGGSGLDCENSQVHVYGSSLDGGAGSSFEGLSAFDGGHGARVAGGSLFASDCSFAGGSGGNSGTDCGDGGHGLFLEAGSPEAWTLGSNFQGGNSVPGFCVTLAGAGVVVQSGTHNTIGKSPLSMTASSPVREGARVALTFEGPPGAFLFLTIGRGPLSVFRAPLNGSKLVARPRHTFALGRIPASGVLETGAPLVPLRGPLGFRVQASYVLAGDVVLGEASTILGLAPPF